MKERIELIIHDAADLSTAKETIALRWDPTVLEELNRDGGGSFRLRREDPLLVEDPTLIQEGRVVRVRVKGQDIALWEIQKITDVVVDEGEYSGRYKEFAGPSLLDWLSHAVVLPEPGIAALSDDRPFNFASKRGSWYVPTQWKNTVPAGVVHDKTQFWGARYPKGWPKGLVAAWVWDRAQSATVWPPAGDAYIRREFTTTAIADYRLVVTCDDYAQILVNGVEAMKIVDQNAATRTYTVDLTLPAGNHVIAAKVRQRQVPGGTGGRGGAGLALALCKIVGDKATDKLVNADRVVWTGDSYSDWVINAYPAKAPGWTPGAILKTLFDEAVSRGVDRLGKFTLGFTDTVDAFGVPWPDTVDPVLKTGDTLREVFKMFSENYVDIWMTPDMILKAAPVRGVDRSVPVGSNDVVAFRPGMNVQVAKTDSTAEIANYAYLKTPAGIVGKPGPAGSVSQFGRRESWLTTDDPTAAGTSAYLTTQLFNKFSMPRRTPTLKIYPDDMTQPYRDFGVGDWVLAPSDTDPFALVKRRVMSISADEDSGNGEVSYTVEIDSIQESYEERIARWLKSMDNSNKSGGVSGTGKSGSLSDLPSIGAPGGAMPVDIPDDDRQPSVPGSLAVSATIVPDDRGVPVGVLSGSFTYDGTATDTSDLPARVFEVYYRVTGTSLYRLLAVTAVTQFTASPVPVYAANGTVLTYDVYVTALGTNGIQSDPSPVVAATMVVDTEPPLQPSVPTAVAVRGVFTVLWNGLDLNGAAMVRDFDHVTVQRRTSTGPDVWADVGRMGRNSSVTLGNLPYGPQTFRLVAYDVTGNASPPSGTVTATTTALVSEQEFTDKFTQINTDIAGVQTNLTGSSTISASAPTAGDLTGKKANSMWTQVVGGKVVGSWYKASDTAPGWTPLPFDPVLIPQISIGAGTFGTLDGVRMTARTIGARELMIGDYTNYLTGGDMEDATALPLQTLNARHVLATDSKYRGTQSLKGLPGAGTATTALNMSLPVAPGEKYLLKVMVMRDAEYNGDGNSKIRMANQSGVAAGDATFSVGDLPLASVWYERTVVVTVAAGTTALTGALWTTNTAGNVWIDDLQMRRMGAGELVVDGSLKAAKIDTNDFFANSAVVGKLNAQIGTFLTNSDGTGMTSTVTGQGLKVTYTDPVTGVVDDRVKVGTFDDDTIQLSDATGKAVVTMNSAGQISGTSGEFSSLMTVGGEDVIQKINNIGQGVVAWRQFANGGAYAYPQLGSAGGEVGLFEMGWDTSGDVPARLYEVNVPKFLLKSTSGAATTMGLILRYTDDGSAPTTSSPIITRDYGYALSGAYRSAGFNGSMVGSPNGPYIRVLVTMFSTGGCMVDNLATPQMSVKDVGLFIDQVGSYTTAGGTYTTGTAASAPTNPVATYTKDFASNYVKSYLANDASYDYNTTKAYQGLSPAGYGNLRSMYCYPSVTSYLAGATIKGIWAYLYFEHWYNNAGGTARIGLHPNSSTPPTWNTTNTVQITVGGWANGVGKWVLLPSSTWEGFRTGAWKGITLLGDSTYNTYGIANASKLRIKYVK